MTLTVLNVAYALATVGPSAIGGSEQVLSAIDRGLVEHGHRSLVVAPAGSEAYGTLYPTIELPRLLDGSARAAAVEQTRRAIDRAMREWEVDVVHLHGLDFYEYVGGIETPALVTAHLPFASYLPAALAGAPTHVSFHCVSESQRRTAPSFLRLLSTIENGVRIPPPRAEWRRGGHVVALGRICPEKGFHLALDAARRAGVELRIAGQLFEYTTHVEYFTHELLPRLDASRRFVGPVHGDPKWRLLAEASCVLIPSLVDETSSLVAMEALACGTPVVAFARGALPEIVRSGETGYVVSDVEEMAEAIACVRSGAIDSRACRRSAVERFAVERMISRYLDRYAALARASERSSTIV